MSRSIRGNKQAKRLCGRIARINNETRYNKLYHDTRNSALLDVSDNDSQLKGSNQ